VIEFSFILFVVVDSFKKHKLSLSGVADKPPLLAASLAEKRS
jgi:hypothetical protein